MKHVVLLLAVTLFAASAQAQLVDLGYAGQLPAKEFLIAIPPVSPATSEKPLPKPIQIFVGADVDTKVHISFASKVAASFEREVRIKAGETYKLDVPLAYSMGATPEDRFGVVNDRTIKVTSDDNVRVAFFIAYLGNGEIVNCPPMSHWGTSYRTPHTFSDKSGTGTAESTGTAIATLFSNDDSNDIDVETTVPLEMTDDITLVEPSHYKVRLDSGESITLKWAYDAQTVRRWESDPSGTLITSSFPIGVVAGASKNAFMRMPDNLPPNGVFAATAHFVRNIIIESVPPTTASGTRFVTVPFMYTTTRTHIDGLHEYGIDNTRGDVVRVIALHDSTIVERTTSNDAALSAVDTLDAGEWYVDAQADKTTLWETSKPVQLWQYGKSYAKIIPPSVNKDNDKTQAHPTVESGMPCLTSVPDVSRLTSRATFHSPEGMDNFVNILFSVGHEDSIYLYGKPLSATFKNAIKSFPRWGYSILRTPVGQGDHELWSNNPEVKFCAWNYGSLDGLQMGRSYAAVADLNGAANLESELEVQATTNCATMSGSAENVVEAERAAAFVLLEPVKLENAFLESTDQQTTTASWNFKPVDALLPASATMRITMSNLRVYEYTHSYTPTTLTPAITTDTVDVHIDSAICITVILRNTTDEPIAVVGAASTDANPPSIEPSSFEVPAGGAVSSTICYGALGSNGKTSTVEFLTTCAPAARYSVKLNPTRSTVEIRSLDIAPLIIGGPTVDTTLTIKNVGSVALNISSVGLQTGQEFSVNQATVPKHIAPGDSAALGIRFVPPMQMPMNGVVIDTLVVECDAQSGNLASLLRAGMPTSVDGNDTQFSVQISPNPLNRDEHDAVRITLPEATNTVEIYDAAGNVVATQLVGDSAQLTINANTFGSAGMYVIVGKNETDAVFRATLVVR